MSLYLTSQTVFCTTVNGKTKRVKIHEYAAASCAEFFLQLALLPTTRRALGSLVFTFLVRTYHHNRVCPNALFLEIDCLQILNGH